MTIPERFAGRDDGSMWNADLKRQGLYFDQLRERLDVWAAEHRPACALNGFCILKPGHPEDCLGLMVLTNIPRDPGLPPEGPDPRATP